MRELHASLPVKLNLTSRYFLNQKNKPFCYDIPKSWCTETSIKLPLINCMAILYIKKRSAIRPNYKTLHEPQGDKT